MAQIYDDLEDELISILTAIDDARQRLDCKSQQLLHLLDRNPDLRKRWLGFVRSGGVTAADFTKYIGGKLRPRITRQRKHLRLISKSRKHNPVRLLKNDSGGEAA
jgi:hypothetical protein